MSLHIENDGGDSIHVQLHQPGHKMRFEERRDDSKTWILYVTMTHLVFGFLYLTAPQLIGSYFIDASYLPFTQLDVACAFWFGVWLTFYAYSFYYGARSELVIQSFFLLAFVMCSIQAIWGSATAFALWRVLPCSLSFGYAGWALTRQPLFQGFSLGPLWSPKLTDLQNMFRLYSALAVFLNGIGYLFFPQETNMLYVPNTPVAPIGLAFLSFNSAIQIGLAPIFLATEDRTFLRNGFVLITVLFIAAVILHPLYATLPMYTFIATNLLGSILI